MDKLDTQLQKNEIVFLSHIIYKNQLKMDLNIRPETVKLLEDNVGKMFLEFGLSNILDLTPKALATKAIIDRRDYIKLKSFHTVTETINRVKR